MPHIDKLKTKLNPQGLGVLAVCDGGDIQQVLQTWKDESFTVRCAINGTGSSDLKRLLGVSEEPTIIVVDAKGMIVAVFDDYYPKAMKKTLEKLGFKY